MVKQLKKILSERLPPGEAANVYSSYDILGDLAIIRLSKESERHGEKIAEALMGVHKNVKTVLAQTGSVQGEFRLRTLEHVAGGRKTAVVHREYGCTFYADVEKCYFSPRLHHERMRIAKQVGKGETIVNMFAGVGCFSVLVARHSDVDKVYSIDVNPMAIRYMQENVRTNGVYGKVIPILGDAKEIIEKRLRCAADRVLMPLPEKALGYLPFALLALKQCGGRINYYDFEYAGKKENPVEKVKLKVAKKLSSLGVAFEIPFGRVVRSTGPNWYQVALDINVQEAKQ